MTSDFETEFARHYRGRHRPEDALWWLLHPTEPGPSSTPPPQNVFLKALDPAALDGDYPYAATLLNAALELLRSDLRLTIDALQLAQTTLDSANNAHSTTANPINERS